MRGHVGRLFGTDGVRGVANADLTAELALGPVGRGGARARRGGHVRGPPAGGRGRAATRAPPGEFLEAAVVAGLASAGVDVLRVGVLPTPAVAYLTGALGADLGVMLSASHNPMPRQRHQVLRPRRPQARRRARGRDRGASTTSTAPASPGTGRPAPASAGCATYDEGFDQYVAHLLGVLPQPPRRAARSSSTARTAPPPGSRPRRSRRAGAEVDHHRRRAGRPEHQRRLRLHPPRTLLQGRRASSTAPTSASPTTATPTAAWPWTPTGEEVDGDQILAVLALALREAGRLRRRHRGRHRDVQPRLPARDGARGHRRWSRPRSATATCWRR